jgi:hypothetical protein
LGVEAQELMTKGREMAVERRRSGILTAGAVLTIVSGGLGILAALSFVGLGGLIVGLGEADAVAVGASYVVLGVIGLPVSILAIVGGARALAMKSFGWALTGGICALLCGGWSGIGILALIFIAISKSEFEQRPS